MASISKRENGSWLARYRPTPGGAQKSRSFTRKLDAQRWLNEVTASIVTGSYVDPKTARMTVEQWCALWIAGYATRRSSTVKSARVHIALIIAEFGPMRLGDVRPSHVRAWTARMTSDGRARSYVYATYRRLAQVMGDAAHDGIISKSPCSRKTSPGQGEQRPAVATTAQVWALYDVMPEHLRPAVLLGAFAGLRTAEVCALRLSDVDFESGVITPEISWPAEPVKSAASRTAIPIPAELTRLLEGSVSRFNGAKVITNEIGQPCSPNVLQGAVRHARGRVEGLPADFRFHDLRHYFASLLIASGLDVKVVQTRLRHASAMTTLNTYGHMWPDSDQSSRAAVSAVLVARTESKLSITDAI